MQRLIRDWQGEVLQMVREQAGSKRTTARYLALGVNGIAVMLMLVAFSATGGLVGAEIGIAGGSAVLAQRILEAIFGDQAVRQLAAQARESLLERVSALMTAERARYDAVLTAVPADEDAVTELVAAADDVAGAQQAEGVR